MNHDAKATTTMITICVTAGSKRSVVKCNSKATTVEQFQELALKALGLLPPESQSTNTIELFVDCFPQPRRPIQPVHHSEGKDDENEINILQQSLFDCGIRHQDRIFVVTSENTSTSEGCGDVTKPKSKQHISPAQPSQQQRSRRKAAIAATESFAATIQQQEDQMVAIAAKASPTKRTTSSKNSSANRHFANLERIANSTNEVIGGRRLRDGAVTTSPGRKRKKVGTTNPSATNRGEDIVEGLVSSTTDTSSSARLMRKGWRQAVESAYEQNQANARVAASQNLTAMVEFTISNGPVITTVASDADRQQPQLQVAYKKGVQGRGVYTDVVDFINYDILVATISEIHPSEALRSFHLALLSPRVFWSLLYHYKNHVTATTGILSQNAGDVVQASLNWCCPNLDWTYLRRRPEQLSEKAKENLRQKHERANSVTSNMDWEAAAAAIMSVEQAMDGMAMVANGGTDSTNQVNVDEDNVNHDDWKLFNDTIFELRDLIDCINSYEADSSDTKEQEVAYYPLNHVVHALTQNLKIQNWNELANVTNSGQELSNGLTKALSNMDQNVISRLILDAEKDVSVQITSAAIEQWIESAQETAAHYSLISICDNNTEIVELLTDTLRCSTPRDLLFWESVPALCVEQIQNRWREVVASSEDMSQGQISEWERIVEENITESNIRKWCRRAHIALGKVTWLNDYVTPLEFE